MPEQEPCPPSWRNRRRSVLRTARRPFDPVGTEVFLAAQHRSTWFPDKLVAVKGRGLRVAGCVNDITVQSIDIQHVGNATAAAEYVFLRHDSGVLVFHPAAFADYSTLGLDVQPIMYLPLHVDHVADCSPLVICGGEPILLTALSDGKTHRMCLNFRIPTKSARTAAMLGSSRDCLVVYAHGSPDNVSVCLIKDHFPLMICDFTVCSPLRYLSTSRTKSYASQPSWRITQVHVCAPWIVSVGTSHGFVLLYRVDFSVATEVKHRSVLLSWRAVSCRGITNFASAGGYLVVMDEVCRIISAPLIDWIAHPTDSFEFRSYPQNWNWHQPGGYQGLAAAVIGTSIPVAVCAVDRGLRRATVISLSAVAASQQWVVPIWTDATTRLHAAEQSVTRVPCGFVVAGRRLGPQSSSFISDTAILTAMSRRGSSTPEAAFWVTPEMAEPTEDDWFDVLDEGGGF